MAESDFVYICQDSANVEGCAASCVGLDACQACQCAVYPTDASGPWGDVLDVLFGLLPILFLIVVTVKPNPWATSLSLPVAALIMWLVRGMYFGSDPLLSAGCIVLGLHEALTPLSIMAGAIFLFETMEATYCLPYMMRELKALTQGHPVAEGMLIFAFATLVEGASGFGTPVALGAPMLVSTGHDPLQAVVLLLIFNTFATVWGAVGTPIWFGFGQVQQVTEDDFLEIASQAAVAMVVCAVLLMPWVLTILIPWSIVKRNIVFLYLALAGTMGPVLGVAFVSYEFPSLLGGLIGCGIAALLIQFKIGLRPLSENDLQALGGDANNPMDIGSVSDLSVVRDYERTATVGVSLPASKQLLTTLPSAISDVTGPGHGEAIGAENDNDDDDDDMEEDVEKTEVFSNRAAKLLLVEVDSQIGNHQSGAAAAAASAGETVPTRVENWTVQATAGATTENASKDQSIPPSNGDMMNNGHKRVSAADPVFERKVTFSERDDNNIIVNNTPNENGDSASRNNVNGSSTAGSSYKSQQETLDDILGPRKTFQEGLLKEMVLRTFPIWGVVLILILTRVEQIGLKQILTDQSPYFEIVFGTYGDFRLSASIVFQLKNILTYPNLNWKYEFIYLPFFIFVFVSALTFVLFRKNLKSSPKQVVGVVISRLVNPAAALFGALVLVQLLINEGTAAPAFILGNVLADWFQEGFVVITPLLGALGSFFSGSTTVSNLTFGDIQAIAAESIGISVTALLSLQAVGASAGNGICLNNIIAACTVVGLQIGEGQILRRTARYVFSMTTIATIVMLAIYFRF